jgi:DNA repair exonuclease SbcCD nuclease subunit
MRKDDYHQSLLAKLQWVCKNARDLGCSTTLLGGGDLFDIPVVNLEKADDFLDVLVNNGMMLATVFGNHDVEATIATSPRSVLGHMMRRSPQTIHPLPILTNDPLLLESHGQDIAVWGHHYKYLNHQDILEVTPVDLAPRVIISHSMLLKQAPVWDETMYELFERVQSNADVILLGHYHPQQTMTRLPNAYQTLIGGPGAMMRGALSHDDLTRRPAMAILAVNALREIRVDFVEIDVAAPAHEIFRLDVAEQEAAKNDALEAFRVNLDSLQIQGLSIAAIIEQISTNAAIPQDVKEEALRRLGVL